MFKLNSGEYVKFEGEYYNEEHMDIKINKGEKEYISFYRFLKNTKLADKIDNLNKRGTFRQYIRDNYRNIYFNYNDIYYYKYFKVEIYTDNDYNSCIKIWCKDLYYMREIYIMREIYYTIEIFMNNFFKDYDIFDYLKIYIQKDDDCDLNGHVFILRIPNEDKIISNCKSASKLS